MEIKIELNDFLLYQVAFATGVMMGETEYVPLDLVKKLYEGQLDLVDEMGTEDYIIELFESIEELKEEIKE